MANQPAKGRKTPTKPNTTKPSETKVMDAEVVVEDVVTPDEVEVTATEPKIENERAAEPVAKPDRPNAEKPAEAPILETESKTSAMPAIFGGLIAGAIGFGAAYLVLPKADAALGPQVVAQSKEISELRDQLAAIPNIDLSGVEAVQAETSVSLTDLDGRITSLESRLEDLSNRAGADGSVSTAAYDQELDTLRAEIEAMRGTAMAELDSARSQAASIQENADAAARNAASRAALARVEGGLETGAPLGAALDDLAAAMQADAPEALNAVRDGVTTLAGLQAAFPEVARAALATARREGVSGEPESGFAAFLRNQLDVRSVAPKEGDSADAVLSRAEASLREGRLTDTLAELSALPEVARADLTEWQALAEARAEALAAVASLTTSLNDN